MKTHMEYIGRCRSLSKSGDVRGFTLLEVLVAIVILSIGILGYMAVEFHSVSSRAFARALHTAMTDGITSLEKLRTVDFADLSGSGVQYFDKITGNPATEADYLGGTAYKAEWRIGDWTDFTANPNSFVRELKTIQVTVYWKEKGLDYSSVFFSFERGRKTGDIS